MRPTEKLITSKNGLGYCCPWLFFQLYKDTAVVAARLGVHKSTVNRAKILAGEVGCTKCLECMKAIVIP